MGAVNELDPMIRGWLSGEKDANMLKIMVGEGQQGWKNKWYFVLDDDWRRKATVETIHSGIYISLSFVSYDFYILSCL